MNIFSWNELCFLRFHNNINFIYKIYDIVFRVRHLNLNFFKKQKYEWRFINLCVYYYKIGKFKIYGWDLYMEFGGQKFEFQISHTLTLSVLYLEFGLHLTLYLKPFEGFFAWQCVFGAKCKMCDTGTTLRWGVWMWAFRPIFI